MEKGMGAIADGFVSEHASGTDDSDRRLLLLHDTALNRTGVRTEDDVVLYFFVVLVVLDEECVLHVSCRVVGCEVQSRKDMPVVFYFRAFGNAESKSCEDVDDFVTHNRQRMACTKFNGICRAGQVKF